MRRLTAVFWLALMVTSAPALGESGETSAWREYERGAAAYNLGQFDQAALYFESAYRLAHDPNMLFNAAQSYGQGGRGELALFFYESYVRTAPAGAPYRAQAQQSIEELRRKLEESKTAAAQETPPSGAGIASASAPAPAVVPQAAPAPQPAPEPAPAPAPQALPQTAPEPPLWGAPVPATSASVSLVAQPQPAAPDASAGEQPVYKTWWFWTAIGTAVAAGTVTAILLAGRSSDACAGVGMDCMRIK